MAAARSFSVQVAHTDLDRGLDLDLDKGIQGALEDHGIVDLYREAGMGRRIDQGMDRGGHEDQDQDQDQDQGPFRSREVAVSCRMDCQDQGRD